MRQHRRTAKTVPNNPRHDNSATPTTLDASEPFDPAEALETLHTEIIQLEAFAHAAGEAVTRLPHSSNSKHRRDLTRIYALVSKVATDAATAATHGDQLIAALSAHLHARRTSRAPNDLESQPTLDSGRHGSIPELRPRRCSGVRKHRLRCATRGCRSPAEALGPTRVRAVMHRTHAGGRARYPKVTRCGAAFRVSMKVRRGHASMGKQ